ncbi:MAG: Trk system potassium transporter TrkA [Eubacteriales bacterium]|nr:Trk system potassium transporter TrkA [Eubacteriales bacterium]
MEIAIVGAGKLGIKIAEALDGGGHSITIIDKEPDPLDRVSQSLDVLTLQGDARDIAFLKEVEINHYDFLISTTGTDDTNLVIAAFAKALGCRRVVARLREPEHMNQFDFIRENFHIDYIVNPDLAITDQIYQYLVHKFTLESGIFSTGSVSVIEFNVEEYPDLIGKSIPEVRRILPDFLVAGISRNGKFMIPHGKNEIRSGDILYFLGEINRIRELKNKLTGAHPVRRAHKIMIIGGGKTGFYLSKRLSDFGAMVKLVEKDLNRCQYLSTHLDNVMVLHANGTDLEFLEDENLDEMDAFVTATGYDEENLLLALTAKKHGIQDVISKVSHESYKELISQMGVDMVLNPLDITASNIVSFIQSANNILSSVIIQGQAELVEIIATKELSMTGSLISELEIPDSILIAGIHRKNEILIPDGRTRIEKDDHVIILSLLSNLKDVEKLLKSKRS